MYPNTFFHYKAPLFTCVWGETADLTVDCVSKTQAGQWTESAKSEETQPAGRKRECTTNLPLQNLKVSKNLDHRLFFRVPAHNESGCGLKKGLNFNPKKSDQKKYQTNSPYNCCYIQLKRRICSKLIPANTEQVYKCSNCSRPLIPAQSVLCTQLPLHHRTTQLHLNASIHRYIGQQVGYTKEFFSNPQKIIMYT